MIAWDLQRSLASEKTFEKAEIFCLSFRWVFFKRLSMEDLLASVSVLLLVMISGLWKTEYVSVNTAIRMRSKILNGLGTMMFVYYCWFSWVFHNRLGISCSVWIWWLHCSCWWLKPSPPKSPLSVMSHRMLQRWLVLEPLQLVCKGPKKLVHIDFSLLLKGVWGYLTAPNPLLVSSALAASDAGGHKGLAVEHCYLHMVACQYQVSNTLAVSICLIYLSISTINLARGLMHSAERGRTVN